MDPKAENPVPCQSADETDALLAFTKKPSPVVSPTDEQKGAGGVTDAIDASFGAMQVSADDDSQYEYNMGHKNRGMFYIINNEKFDHSKTGMKDRSGTDADAANLYQRFKALGFDIKMRKDLAAAQMLQLMTEAAKLDHTNNDCFGCAILSHGDEGLVYGTDTFIEIDKLVAPFKGENCRSLLGKPKMLFVQACRDHQLDPGVEIQSDADEEKDVKVYRIPSEADFLYAYSTIPGYFSWRNSSNGSWFVQALCKVLKEYGDKRDMMWMLTRVNHMVAFDFQSNASQEFMNKKKHIPSIVSMLTKDLVLKPKK